jgi:hypothetical protein
MVSELREIVPGFYNPKPKTKQYSSPSLKDLLHHLSKIPIGG